LLRQLGLALVLAVTILGVWEGFWRAKGFLPRHSLVPSWVVWRHRVEPTSTVVLGTSRVQAALDLDVWESATGARPIQLAVLGSTPLPALDDLAEDSEFRGLVLVDLLPLHAFDALGSRANVEAALDEYEASLVSPSRRTEAVLRFLVSSAFVFRDAVLSPPGVLTRARRGERAIPNPAIFRSDRFTRFDYTGRSFLRRVPRAETPANYEAARRRGRPADDAQYEVIVQRLEAAVETIQSRGGRVVFIALPACGTRKEIEEERYPRARYWDPLAARTTAIAIHADDYPQLLDFDCYDGSHMDMRDAAVFTRRLAGIVSSGSATPER
jgi:hypothetical protein